MRASAIRLVPILLLVCLFLSIWLVSAQDQPQRKGFKGRQSSVRTIGDFPTTKWLDEDVRYIITNEERTAFKRLETDEERDEFVEAFWDRRNPNPFSGEDRFKEEHYARIVYANERFASRIPGWKTDRGRIYITYGPPDAREEFPGNRASPGTNGALLKSSSSEIWRYDSIHGLPFSVFFVFLDQCGCGEYLLQQNPRGEIRMLYGPPEWVENHYSDTNNEVTCTQPFPRDWEVWHYRSVAGIVKDIGFEVGNAYDCGKPERL